MIELLHHLEMSEKIGCPYIEIKDGFLNIYTEKILARSRVTLPGNLLCTIPLADVKSAIYNSQVLNDFMLGPVRDLPYEHLSSTKMNLRLHPTKWATNADLRVRTKDGLVTLQLTNAQLFYLVKQFHGSGVDRLCSMIRLKASQMSLRWPLDAVDAIDQSIVSTSHKIRRSVRNTWQGLQAKKTAVPQRRTQALRGELLTVGTEQGQELSSERIGAVAVVLRKCRFTDEEAWPKNVSSYWSSIDGEELPPSYANLHDLLNSKYTTVYEKYWSQAKNGFMEKDRYEASVKLGLVLLIISLQEKMAGLLSNTFSQEKSPQKLYEVLTRYTQQFISFVAKGDTGRDFRGSMHFAAALMTSNTAVANADAPLFSAMKPLLAQVETLRKKPEVIRNESLVKDLDMIVFVVEGLVSFHADTTRRLKTDSLVVPAR